MFILAHETETQATKYTRRLAKIGMIPTGLEQVDWTQIYAVCKLTDDSKGNWKGSSSNKGIRISIDDETGVGVSPDHLVSHKPSLMSQVTGRLTHKRYCGAAVFADHFSDLVCSHLITSTSMEEIMNGKYAYENFAYHHGVNIKHYRGDNLR